MPCIAFTAFLGIFALDVFNGPAGAGEKLLGLAIHLIPTWLVLIALAITWQWNWIGALAFPLLAIVHFASKRHLGPWAYAAIEARQSPSLPVEAKALPSWIRAS